MSLIQKFALLYAAMFFFIAVMGAIPSLVDEHGLLFGLFTLDVHDNLLHAGSGLWALIAGLISKRAATQYFKIFGVIYCLDGVVGLFLGNAYLDFGLFLYGIADTSLLVRFLTNIPHIAIGGSQALLGFGLDKVIRK